MTRIKSYWWKPGEMDIAEHGLTSIRVVSENGRWRHALFVFSEYQMRWERSDDPQTLRRAYAGLSA